MGLGVQSLDFDLNHDEADDESDQRRTGAADGRAAAAAAAAVVGVGSVWLSHAGACATHRRCSSPRARSSLVARRSLQSAFGRHAARHTLLATALAAVLSLRRPHCPHCSLSSRAGDMSLSADASDPSSPFMSVKSRWEWAGKLLPLFSYVRPSLSLIVIAASRSIEAVSSRCSDVLI